MVDVIVTKSLCPVNVQRAGLGVSIKMQMHTRETRSCKVHLVYKQTVVGSLNGVLCLCTYRIGLRTLESCAALGRSSRSIFFVPPCSKLENPGGSWVSVAGTFVLFAE